MKMSRMKKGLAAGLMVLVILSAVYRINIHLCPDFHAYDGVCWSHSGIRMSASCRRLRPGCSGTGKKEETKNEKRSSIYMLIKNHALCMLSDTGSVFLSYVMTFIALYGTLPSGFRWYGLLIMFGIYLLSSMTAGKPYSPEKGTAEILTGVLQQTVHMALFLAVFLLFFERNSLEAKTFFVLQVCFLVLCLNLGRMYCKAVLFNYYSKEKNKTRLVIFSNRTNALNTMRRLAGSNLYQYELTALAIADGENGQTELNLIRYDQSGTRMEEIEEPAEAYLRRQAVDEALLSLPDSSSGYINSLLKTLQSMGIVVHVTADSLGLSEEAKQVGELGNYRVLTYGARIFTPVELFVKRAMDICGAVIGLLFTGILSIVGSSCHPSGIARTSDF